MVIAPECDCRLSMLGLGYIGITLSIPLTIQLPHSPSLEYFNPTRLETKHHDLIHPVRRKPLLPISPPRIPRFFRTNGYPGIRKAIGLYKCSIFIQNRVEVTSNQPTACTPQK